MTITQMRADAISSTNPAYPNKRIKSSNVNAVGDAVDVTSDDQVLDSVFVFTTEKSPFDVRCFPITNEDIVVGSFSLKYTLPAADWGSSAKDKLTLSLDKRESAGGSAYVLAIRDENGRKIGHFEDFQDHQHTFMKLFFELNDDLSAQATISFPHPHLLAEIKIGLPQETIQRHLATFSGAKPSEKLAFFLLYLKCGSRLGQLPKVVVPSSPSSSAFEKLQPTGLVSKLLEFQRTTVGWMLEREGAKVCPGASLVEQVDIPPIRSLIELIPDLYFDVASGYYTDSKDAGQYEIIQGGILCDEVFSDIALLRFNHQHCLIYSSFI